MPRTSFWILIIGLSATFLYAGVDMIRHPGDWIGFFPEWMLSASPLKDKPLAIVDGVVQIVLALGLLHPKFFRLSAAVLAIMLFGILVTSGPLLITFRDIGLLAMALALVVYPSPKRSVAPSTPIPATATVRSEGPAASTHSPEV